MKIFQILRGFCHWDATAQFPTLKSTEGRFAPNVLFVEAPDYVFEGWGYDAEAEGDARFIQPIPPDGWLYDPETGTFYEEGSYPLSRTAAEMREHAYNTQLIVEWSGNAVTVTEAATLWQYYAAEGNAKAAELQTLIAAAKASIREQYPDESVEA